MDGIRIGWGVWEWLNRGAEGCSTYRDLQSQSFNHNYEILIFFVIVSHLVKFSIELCKIAFISFSLLY